MVNHRQAYLHLLAKMWRNNRSSLSTPTRLAAHREWQAWRKTWAKGEA